MKKLVLSSALFVALCTPALAMGWTGWGGNHDPGGGGNYRGAPGPIAGAGLPVLAVGYGVYWLVRRRKSK
jgi:hypothetical protein